MKQLKKKKPNKQQITTRNMMLVTILVSVLISMLMTFIMGAVLFKYIGKREDPTSVSKISYLIQEAVSQLYEQTPTASYSDQLFVDDAKITFTKSGSVSLVHFYENSSGDNQEIVYLSDARKISTSTAKLVNNESIKAALNHVPYLQRCARQFAVTFTDAMATDDYDYDQVSQKTLTDGRTAYIWKISERACSSYDYYPYEDDLLQVIQSIQSY